MGTHFVVIVHYHALYFLTLSARFVFMECAFLLIYRSLPSMADWSPSSWPEFRCSGNDKNVDDDAFWGTLTIRVFRLHLPST